MRPKRWQHFNELKIRSYHICGLAQATAAPASMDYRGWALQLLLQSSSSGCTLPSSGCYAGITFFASTLYLNFSYCWGAVYSYAEGTTICLQFLGDYEDD
eukprot:8148-Heterococcus_DN1.PRE.2